LKSRDVVTIGIDATVETALQIMADEDILSIPIVDGEKKAVVGTISVTDLTIAIAFQECFAQLEDEPRKIEDLNKEGFDKLLKTSVFSAKAVDFLGLSSESKRVWEYEAKEPVDTVLELFSKGVHRVLVRQEDGKLRILSQSDIVDYLKDNLAKFAEFADTPLNKTGLVDEKEKPKLVTVSMYQSALTGFHRVYNQGWELGGIPVVDKSGDIVTTLSASDLRGLNKNSFKTLLLPVLDFFTSSKRWCTTCSYRST